MIKLVFLGDCYKDSIRSLVGGDICEVDERTAISLTTDFPDKFKHYDPEKHSKMPANAAKTSQQDDEPGKDGDVISIRYLGEKPITGLSGKPILNQGDEVEASVDLAAKIFGTFPDLWELTE